MAGCGAKLYSSISKRNSFVNRHAFFLQPNLIMDNSVPTKKESNATCWGIPTDPFHADSPSGLLGRRPTLPTAPTDDCRHYLTEGMSVGETHSVSD